MYKKNAILSAELESGMEGYLVGLADFKSVVPRQQSGQVGSIPTHSRYFFGGY